MKKFIHLLLFIIILSNISYSQLSEGDTALVKYFRLDFAVPDQPAFKMLGTNPSDLLRPSTVSDLAVITSNFVSGNSIVLPQSFSMEVAPIVLARANSVTLKDYLDNKILYSLRISVGTFTEDADSVANQKLSIGARISFIDNGDMKSDPYFIDKTLEILADKTKYENELKDEFLKKENKLAIDLATDADLNKRYEEYVDEHLDEYSKQKGFNFDERLNEEKDKYARKNWNKQKLDFAVAVLSESPDSSASNLKFDEVGIWGVFAAPIGTWGQLLFGANYYFSSFDSLIRTSNTVESFNDNQFSLNTRFYFGANRIKCFLEGQYSYAEFKPSPGSEALLNLGAEVNITNGIWFNFNVGYNFFDINKTSAASDLFSDFDIRFQLPEKFNLF